jgi:hypothetical protein
MISRRILLLATLTALVMPVSAHAQLLGGGSDRGDRSSRGGLLENVLGGGSSRDSDRDSLLGVVGGRDSGVLITIGEDAGSSGAVNLGVGGRDGLVSAAVGSGSRPLVDASVLGPRGIADVDVDLGDVRGNVNVGGRGLIDIDLDLPNGGDGGDGGNGGGGNNGGNGGNGNNGGNGTNGRNGGVVIGYGSYGAGSGSAACATSDPNQLVSLFQGTSLSGWNRASNIQLIPVQVCSEVRGQVAAWLAANPSYHNLVGAVASDALINAALSRTRYQPGHVLGVQRQGQTLMVYVF